MSVEENKALIQRYIEEVWNKGSIDVLDELYEARFNGGYGGVAGLKAAITSYRTSFPDLHFTIEEAIAEEDKICLPVDRSWYSSRCVRGHRSHW